MSSIPFFDSSVEQEASDMEILASHLEFGGSAPTARALRALAAYGRVFGRFSCDLEEVAVWMVTFDPSLEESKVLSWLPTVSGLGVQAGGVCH